VRTLATALVFGGAVLLMAASPSAAQAPAPSVPPVDVIEVSGLVDPVVVDFVERSIEAAAEDGAQALVIQLNSRDAAVSDDRMGELAEAVETAPVPVGVWVGPSGARAYGQTGLLLDAADITGIAPGARVGEFGTPPEGRDPVGGAAADRVVDASVGADDAVSLGVIDVVAPVLGDFIVGLDGLEVDGRTLSTARVVQTDDGPRREPTAQVRFAQLDLLDELFHTVASPPVAYLLLLTGLSLLVFEFFTAGIGIAGVVGAGCLILAAYGIDVLPARWWALALLVVSIAGFAVDVQTGVPRFWTGVGIVALVVGSFFLYDGLSLSWITLLAGIAGVLLAMLTGMPAIVRTRFATPTIGRDWMIGETGEAVERVAPDGLVRVRDALWPAHTNRATPIAPGDPIRVVSIDGLVLEVEPESGGARDYRERRGR